MLDLLEKQKQVSDKEIRGLKAQNSQNKLSYRQELESALEQIGSTKVQLDEVVSKREDSLRNEMEEAKTRCDRLENELKQFKADGDGVEGLVEMRDELAEQQVVIHDLKQDNRQLLKSIASQNELTKEAQFADKELRQKLGDVLEERRVLLCQIEGLTQRGGSLEEQLSAAEMQVTRLSSNNEKRLATLQTHLSHSEAEVAKLQHQLLETTHALDHERYEQTKQYDYSASVQESLRQHNDTLLQSLAELENNHVATQSDLIFVKKDATRRLQDREERIAQLENEVFKRSTERKKVVAEGCSDCKEHEERTLFLEGEVVRLRELVGRMRLESADREGEYSRLNLKCCYSS